MGKNSLRVWIRIAMAVLTLALVAGPAVAQKKKKNAEKEDKSAVIPADAANDNTLIDQALTEMMAGWQIGDTSLMQKHYSADAVFVSGSYEPPLLGWTNYAQNYQAQKARMANVAMDRFNTLIRVKGTSAISNYQWQFSATVDGNPMWARGHSSLVWEKRDGKWLVTHNHTSLVDQGVPKAATPAAAPAKKP